MVKRRHGERPQTLRQVNHPRLQEIEGVNTKEEVTWYAGKHMAYIYKAKVKKDGSHYCCIWGKVTRPHGNTGVVCAKFTSNLPPKSMIMYSVPYALISSCIESLGLGQGILILMHGSCRVARLSQPRTEKNEFRKWIKMRIVTAA